MTREYRNENEANEERMNLAATCRRRDSGCSILGQIVNPRIRFVGDGILFLAASGISAAAAAARVKRLTVVFCVKDTNFRSGNEKPVRLPRWT